MSWISTILLRAEAITSFPSKNICVSDSFALRLSGRRSARSTKRPVVILVTNLWGMGEYPGPITKSFPTAADETEMVGKADTTRPESQWTRTRSKRKGGKTIRRRGKCGKVETNEGPIKVHVIVAWLREACVSGASDHVEITVEFEFGGAGCNGMALWLCNAARMPGKLSVNAFDIAWANASLLVLMFCLSCKMDGPAEDSTSAPDDGTTSLSPSNMVVARLLFVVPGIKSTQKNMTKTRSVEAEGQGI